ncbi:unnamed protein product, partial [Adineta ricciae]
MCQSDIPDQIDGRSALSKPQGNEAQFPDRTISYSDPIGSNTEFYRILQEFDGSDEILVTESHWIPTVSDPKHG